MPPVKQAPQYIDTRERKPSLSRSAFAIAKTRDMPSIHVNIDKNGKINLAAIENGISNINPNILMVLNPSLGDSNSIIGNRYFDKSNIIT